MDKALRVLFDTNVYGTIVEKNKSSFLERIDLTSNIVVYGFNLIRRELRNTPKTLMHGKRNFRGIVLYQYDTIIKNHELELNKIIEGIAQEYLNNYVGGISKQELKNDFLIVACASLHHLDIIVTEDNHSMLSKKALETYQKVNNDNNLRTPKFHSLEEIEKLL
ncbi:MAG: hypothetical protein Q7S21_02705 [archaeon]|nr:hypothetical protein [archaeon]